jgi:hypothetical protein
MFSLSFGALCPLFLKLEAKILFEVESTLFFVTFHLVYQPPNSL